MCTPAISTCATCMVYDEQFVIEKLPTELQVADVGCTFKGSSTFLTLKQHLMTCARVVHDDNLNPFWESNEADVD